jgi:hypothetical protein
LKQRQWRIISINDFSVHRVGSLINYFGSFDLLIITSTDSSQPTDNWRRKIVPHKITGRK